MNTVLWLFAIVFVPLLIMLFLTHKVVASIFGFYRVVPVNEAHVRIYKNSKEVFSSRTKRTTYWYMPGIMKIHKLPLSNLPIPVNDIKLNDKDMAKFQCDIMCFVNIDNIELAAERLVLTEATNKMGFDFEKLSVELKAIIESLCRTVATKQSILDIYRDRSTLDLAITREVDGVFPKWGICLVDLELKDIKDTHDSTVIRDIETMRAAEIRRDSDIAIAKSNRAAQFAQAEAEEEVRKRQIQKDRNVGLADAGRAMEVATAQAEANKTSINAKRELDFGNAEINRQVLEKNAQGRKLQLVIEAEGEAQKVEMVGKAEANVVQLKKEADAAGTMRQAEALAKFDEAGLSIRVLEAQRDVAMGRNEAYAKALSAADIKLILSGAQAGSLFGLKLDAETGASLELFAQQSGISLDKIKEVLQELKSKKSIS